MELFLGDNQYDLGWIQELASIRDSHRGVLDVTINFSYVPLAPSSSAYHSCLTCGRSYRTLINKGRIKMQYKIISRGSLRFTPSLLRGDKPDPPASKITIMYL